MSASRQGWPGLRAESEAFLHLDALRFIAAMAIVIFHWRGAIGVVPLIEATRWMGAWMVFVDLFFCVSGVVICAMYAERLTTPAQVGDFLRRRFARLAPLHYATLALYLVTVWVFADVGFERWGQFDPKCIAPNILFLQAFGVCADLSYNFPAWSISAEIACYALFPLMLPLYRWRAWAPGVLGVLMLAALYAIGPQGDLQRPWHQWTFDFGPLRALPAFAIGVSLFGMREALARIPAAGALGFVSLVILALAGVLHIPAGAQAPLAYAVVLFALAADTKGRASGPVRRLAPFGQLTYSLYMLHAPVMTLVFMLFFDRALNLAPWAKFTAVLACVPALMALSYVSLVFFEGPARRWLTRTGAVRKAAVATAGER